MSCTECSADDGHFAICSRNQGRKDHGISGDNDNSVRPGASVDSAAFPTGHPQEVQERHIFMKGDLYCPHCWARPEKMHSENCGKHMGAVKLSQCATYLNERRSIPPTTFAPEHENLLTEALRIIYGDREKTYGSPDRNLKLIADMWTNYCSSKCYPNLGFKFNADDVCLMMILLKVARLANSPDHHDSQVDLAGYVALMERVQEHARKNPVNGRE